MTIFKKLALNLIYLKDKIWKQKWQVFSGKISLCNYPSNCSSFNYSSNFKWGRFFCRSWAV